METPYRPLPRLRVPMQQTCKMCAQPDKFNFDVPDDVWRAVVPPEFQYLVVCLYCFDEQAALKGISYVGKLSKVCFAGRATSIAFAIEDAVG